MRTKFFILFIILTSFVQAKRYVVEFSHPLEKSHFNILKSKNINVESLAVANDDYFKRAFVFDTRLEINELKKTISTVATIKNIEQVIRPNLFTVIPSSSPKMLVEDKLFPYQWSLYNQDQAILREVGPLETRKQVGINNFDLDWSIIKTDLPLILKRDVSIALLDTGIDFDHPELKHALLYNNEECGQESENLIDKDGNGFIGDCLGWNFTRARDSKEARNVMDFSGHGTHLAGIISALSDKNGITGIYDKIKILPIKVVVENNLENEAEVEFSDRLAAAIVYATNRKVDVINLSLGWPRSLDVEHLRRAIQYAQSQGVFIVAAAGNNNSDEPIFPCAYEGVICVGASGIDKKSANFSNFGSTVDLFAPGESILSTYPSKLTPEIFHVPGYEFKSGTSQAAPMVAAMVALLRGQNPDQHPLQIISKLYSSALPFKDDQKYVSFGNVSLKRALQSEIPVFIKPQVKTLRQIFFTKDNLKGNFILPFLSHTNEIIPEVNITVEAVTRNLQIVNRNVQLRNIQPFEARNIRFAYDVLNLNHDSMVELKITLNYAGKIETYFNKLPLIRDVRQDSGVSTLKFEFKDRPLPVAQVAENQLRVNLSTVDQIHHGGSTHYFLRRSVSANEQNQVRRHIEITFFERQVDKIVEMHKKIVLDQAAQLVSITKVDANYDGTDDFMVQYIYETDGKRHLRFQFVDAANLLPTFKDKSVWDFLPDSAVIDFKTLRFLKGSNQVLGNHIIPVFMSRGSYPVRDQDPSYWVRPVNSNEYRLYYLSPELSSDGVSLQTRTFSTVSWANSIREKFSLKWNDPVNFFDLISQSKKSFNNGVVDALAFLGSGERRKIVTTKLSLDQNHQYKEINLSSLRLEQMERKKLMTFGDVEGDVFWSSFDQTNSRFVGYNATSEEIDLNFVYKHTHKSDTILNHISSFSVDGIQTHFLQSRNLIIAIKNLSDKRVVQTRNMLRFSFLPGSLLSEIYYPIWTRSEDELSPSLYVDSTQITGNRIYTLVSENNQFISPSMYSVFIPTNCKAMNPLPTENGEFSYELLCSEQNQWVLRSMKLNL